MTGPTRAGMLTVLLGLAAGVWAGPATATPANDPADVRTLVSHLSGGYGATGCKPKAEGYTGPARAMVGCGANHDPGGPGGAGYLLYANTTDLAAVSDPDDPVRTFPDGSKGPTLWCGPTSPRGCWWR